MRKLLPILLALLLLIGCDGGQILLRELTKPHTQAKTTQIIAYHTKAYPTQNP